AEAAGVEIQRLLAVAGEGEVAVDLHGHRGPPGSGAPMVDAAPNKIRLMLDVNLLRKDLNTVIARLEARKSPQPYLDVAAFQRLEAERKTIQTRTEELQARRNQLSKQIGQLKAKGENADAVMAEVAQAKAELDQSAARLEQIQPEMQALLLAVPNLPHESVPVGSDETGNVEVRKWGTPRQFDFAVKDHVDVGTPLGLDFETGVKLSGARFTVMKGQVARL